MLLLKVFQNIEKEEKLPHLLWSKYNIDTKTWQRLYKRRKLSIESHLRL